MFGSSNVTDVELANGVYRALHIDFLLKSFELAPNFVSIFIKFDTERAILELRSPYPVTAMRTVVLDNNIYILGVQAGSESDQSFYCYSANTDQ